MQTFYSLYNDFQPTLNQLQHWNLAMLIILYKILYSDLTLNEFFFLLMV